MKFIRHELPKRADLRIGGLPLHEQAEQRLPACCKHQ
jgi:hypothetical protein